jgi:hypothetical protein
MMRKCEARRMRREVRGAPLDHTRVQINALVTLRSGLQLDQLAREPATATSEIEHAAKLRLSNKLGSVGPTRAPPTEGEEARQFPICRLGSSHRTQATPKSGWQPPPRQGQSSRPRWPMGATPRMNRCRRPAVLRPTHRNCLPPRRKADRSPRVSRSGSKSRWVQLVDRTVGENQRVIGHGLREVQIAAQGSPVRDEGFLAGAGNAVGAHQRPDSAVSDRRRS